MTLGRNGARALAVGLTLLLAGAGLVAGAGSRLAAAATTTAPAPVMSAATSPQLAATLARRAAMAHAGVAPAGRGVQAAGVSPGVAVADGGLTIVFSANPALPGQPFTTTVTVAHSGVVGVPTGNVTVTFAGPGGNTSGSIALVSNGTDGVAAVPDTLPTGAYTATAAYTGEAGVYTANSSAGVPFVVSGAGQVSMAVRSEIDPTIPNEIVPVDLYLGPGNCVSQAPWRLTVDGTTVAGGPFCADTQGFAFVPVGGLPAGTHLIVLAFAGSVADAPDSLTVTQFVADADPNLRYVNEVYNDVLDRIPDLAGAQWWATQLDTNNKTRPEAALSLLDSDEYRGDQITADYHRVFGRDADSQGLAFYIAWLRSGHSYEQLLGDLLGADEYFINAGSTNARYVNAVYGTVFGRSADPSGLAFWTARLDGGEPRYIFSFEQAMSVENLSNFVGFTYATLLGRLPDPDGLAFWVHFVFISQNDNLLVAGVMSSAEYYNVSQIFP